MKTRYLALALLPLCLLVATAYAQWPPIGNGYAVTTNWHGKNVPIGESVTAWAGTQDTSVTQVEFRWHDPAEQTVWDVTVPVFGPYTTSNVPLGVPEEIVEWSNDNPGYIIWYATNTQVPDLPGEWGVQAIFRDPTHGGKGQDSTKVMIRSTSVNVIPEVPIVGTVGAAAVMLLGIGLFAKRTRKTI